MPKIWTYDPLGVSSSMTKIFPKVPIKEDSLFQLGGHGPHGPLWIRH